MCQVFANQPKQLIHRLEKKLKDSGVIQTQELLSMEDFIDTVETMRGELKAYHDGASSMSAINDKTNSVKNLTQASRALPAPRHAAN